jgi:transmembrane sensor
MSATPNDSAINTAAKIDLRAAAWIERRDREGWSEKDETELSAWLDENPAHRINYWRAEVTWHRTERLAALRPPARARAKASTFFRVAAAVMLATIIAGGVWTYRSQPSSMTYATSIGGHETVMLTDSSRIELNTDTAIRISETATARKIWLEKGEAFFQVTHDANRPLTVFVDSRRITDLGTQFIIRREDDRLEVSVVEGRVSFDAADDAQGSKSLRLSQGDAVLASAAGLTVTRKSALQLSDELGWRRGVIVFKHTPLVEAAEQVSRYNAVKVTIAGESLGRLPIDGTLSATDPQEFLRLARVVFGLRTEKVAGSYVISR